MLPCFFRIMRAGTELHKMRTGENRSRTLCRQRNTRAAPAGPAPRTRDVVAPPLVCRLADKYGRRFPHASGTATRLAAWPRF